MSDTLNLFINTDEFVIPISLFEEHVEIMNNKIYCDLIVHLDNDQINATYGSSSQALATLGKICMDNSISTLEVKDENEIIKFSSTNYSKAESLGTTLTKYPQGESDISQDSIETMIMFRKEVS